MDFKLSKPQLFSAKRRPLREKKRNSKTRPLVRSSLTCSLPGGFPDRYNCVLRTASGGTATFVGTGVAYTYVFLNSYIPITGNYPTSLAFLLGQVSSSGTASAPYVNYVVRKSRFTLTTNIAAAATGTAIEPCVSLVPLSKGQLTTTMSPGTGREFTRAKWMPLEDSASAGNPQVLTWQADMYDLVGLERPTDIRSIGNLAGAWNAAPTDTYTLAVIFGTETTGTTTDATFKIAYNMQVTQWYEFFNRNGPDSSAPA